MFRFSFLLTVGLFAGVSVGVAQTLPSAEEGRPFSHRFGWEDYQGYNQNWAVAQTPSGLIYVANSWGVLEYDGSDWRMMPVVEEGRQLVRSIAATPSGDLYVGGVGEIGWLVPDSTQTLAFESLTHRIPARYRDVTDVWSTHVTAEGIVFQTPQYLYRWTGRSMQVWAARTSYHLAFSVRGSVYVREEGVGLKRLDGDQLVPVPGGAAFADRRIFSLLPHPRGLLAAVRDEGLWLLTPSGASPIQSTASAYLAEHRPYGGLTLPNAYGRPGSLYAVATFGGGVVVFDAEGRLVRIHQEDAGLDPDDWVLGMATDAQGGLWMALTDGIVRADLFPRMTQYGSGRGLTGEVYTVRRHQGKLYVGTSTGLFVLVPGRLGIPGEGDPYSRFEHVQTAGDADLSQTWDLLDSRGDLLVAANSGVFVLRGDRLVSITDVKAFRLQHVPGGDDVIAGGKDGLTVLKWQDGSWRSTAAIEVLGGDVNSVEALGSRDLWVGRMSGGIVRLRASADGVYQPTVFGTDEGLAEGPATVLIRDGRLLVIQQAGVLELRTSADGPRFVRATDSRLTRLSGEYGLFEGDNRRLWTYLDTELTAFDGSRPALRLRMGWTRVETLYEEPNGVTWVGTNDGLYRYDPRVPAAPRTFPAFVRRVTDEQRQTLYGGARPATIAGTPSLTLPYATNSLRFEFGAAAYSRPGETEFQYRLDGRDDGWSPWSGERSTNYTDLWEGTYTFRVRARDASGAVSQEAAYTLRVLPPIHRTPLAYLVYLLAAAGFIWGITAWRLRQHRRHIEAQRARNARLHRLGDRLRETNARLRSADKLKDDLLANTSHELRTPLTAVLGFSEMLLDEIPDEQRDLALGIHRGGTRLLGTVNGLLDMYKLQSGTLDVYAEPFDGAALARETVHFLQPIAQERGLTLRVLPADIEVPIVSDRGVLERLITNLVGNALKFTTVGGVDVLVDALEDRFVLTVRDTGIGIPPEMLGRVFEPFEQVSTGHARSHEGTGLGLAIVRRLVDLMGGDIDIESEVGVGTRVAVTLPRQMAGALNTRVVEGHQNPALTGAHVLGLGLTREVSDPVRRWVEPSGRLDETHTLGRAVRGARRTTYDAILVVANRKEVERKQVGVLRRVPGYALTPLVRVGGTPLSAAELASRGFSHQVALPLTAAEVIPLLEHALSRVESDEEIGSLA